MSGRSCALEVTRYGSSVPVLVHRVDEAHARLPFEEAGEMECSRQSPDATPAREARNVGRCGSGGGGAVVKTKDS
jgi:hypothetical protein